MPNPSSSAPVPAPPEVAEGVRATIAAYAHALDDGRTDDLVALFLPDGVAEIPGFGTHDGHDAIRAAFGRWTPTRPQRHLVSNTLVVSTGDGTAQATSDLVFLLERDTGWGVELVGRYHDDFQQVDGRWLLARRVATVDGGPA